MTDGARLRPWRSPLLRRLGAMTAVLAVASWICTDLYRHEQVSGVPLALVDQDGSRFARTLQSLLAARRELDLRRPGPATVAEAEELLARGGLGGYVVVPAGFAAALQGGGQAQLLLATSMGNLVTGRTVHRAVSQCAAALGVGVQLALAQKLGVPGDGALARVMPLQLVEGLPGNPALAYGPYLASVYLLFLLNLYFTLACATLLYPGQLGGGPGRRVAAVVGLLVACCGLGLLQQYGLLAWLGLAPRAPWPIVLALLASFLLLEGALVTVAALWLPWPLPALQLPAVLAVLSLMLAGVTWPLDAFPAPLAGLARWLPFTPLAEASRLTARADSTVAAFWTVAWRPYLQQALLYGALLLAGVALRLLTGGWRRRPPRRTAPGAPLVAATAAPGPR